MKKIEGPQEIPGDWWMDIDPALDIEFSRPLNETQTLVQKEVKLKLDLDEDYFDSLHDKIMAKVEQTDINVDKTEKWKMIARRAQRAVAVFVAVSMFGLSQQTQTKVIENGITETVAMTNAVSKSDIDIEAVLTHQQKSDFFVDVIAESADHLTIDQINNLMGERQAN